MALDPLTLPLLEAFPALCRALVETDPQAARTVRDDHGERWTAAEVVAHLADVQIWAYADRVARMLTQRDPTFEDQDEVAHLQESGLDGAPLEDALAAFEMRRRWTLPMLEAASGANLERSAQHGLLGSVTIGQIGHVWALHDLVHFGQILRLLQRPFWAGMGPTRSFYADATASHATGAGGAAAGSDGATHITATLAETPALVAGLLELLPPERVTAPADPPEPGGWAPRDVVAHWLETERVGFAGRISRLLSADHPTLAPRDPAADLDASGYRSQPLDELLDAWSDLRADSIAHLDELTPAQLARGGRHPSAGDLTVAHLAHEWAYHDLEHLGQLTKMLAASLLPHIGPFVRFYPNGAG